MFVSSVSPFRSLGFESALSIRGPRRSAGPATVARDDASMRQLAKKVLDLRQGLDRLRDSARLTKKGSKVSRAASSTSGSSLGLSVAVTFTTRGSTEQVNTVPTSFTQREPGFAGESTSSVLIGGVYDGSSGDDTLTFRARNRGTIGSDNITFQVLDGEGKNLGNVQFRSSDPIGEPKTLANGMTVSLSAGEIQRHDTFTVDVYQTVGSVVKEHNPFDGVGDSDPLFDPGMSVTAGSFEVNGEVIDVFQDDTLDGVLQRISSSGAGVLATFDASTERVVLTQTTPGPEAITVDNDTSGFLDATKLSGSSQVLGVDTDLKRRIADVPSLSGIRSGDFSINGQSFLVDVTVDSLQDLFDRVNGSSAGASIGFDPATNRVSVTATAAGGSLELDSGSSRLFETLDMVEGALQPRKAGRRRPVFSEEQGFRRYLDRFGEDLQELFDGDFGGLAAGAASAAKTRIRAEVKDSFRDLLERDVGDRLRSGLGIDFRFDEVEKGVLRIDERGLNDAFSDHSQKLAEFLVGAGDASRRNGLLDGLDEALDLVAKDLRGKLNQRLDAGLWVDLLA